MSDSSSSSLPLLPSNYSNYDCGEICSVHVAHTMQNDLRKYFRYMKVTGCKYFSWVDGEDGDSVDLKYQMCGMQESIMSRLDGLEDKLVDQEVPRPKNLEGQGKD